MRTLLNNLGDWLFEHSPARIPALLSRVEHLERRMRGVEHLEARMVAMEALLDRMGPVSTEEREIRDLVRKAYDTPEGREALDWLACLSAEKLAVVLQRAAAEGQQ
jgi:hypothetical protein